MRIKVTWAFVLLIVLGCKKENAKNTEPEGFESIPIAKPLVPSILDEASGIADSKTNPGYLWVQQDGGNHNDIALLSQNGSLLKRINIKSAVNRDWEDLATGLGPVAGNQYIYIADIGDNTLAASQYFIYRFIEPASANDSVLNSDKITFQYPDGAHDAEAILVENSSKDIYIITKQDSPSRIYKISYPQNTGAINTAILVGSLSFGGVTGAAMSADGKEILVRTYNSVFYWQRTTNQTLEQALSGSPVSLDTQFEPQGEAICFKNDNSGFFTLSERPAIIAAVNLNFYKRK
ncbi:MAG TPA: hypothetical protein VFD56_06625 [Chitinophagaceae bacterium]|nr:hypothetical protein [Chitinophagaceae bacterium]